MWLAWRDIAQLSYTDLIRAVEHGKVASVTITETMIEGQFKEPQDGRRLFISARVDPNAAAAFDKAGVKVLVGDWTNGDPAITRFLEKHGRSGVPLYLYYAPGKPVQMLPQLLTPSMVTALVK